MSILELIESEIFRLQQARQILLGRHTTKNGIHIVRRRRPMSPETKAKIGAAMRKNWKTRKAA